VIITRLELLDWRNYARLALDLADGTVAVLGDNGQGKTNLTESLGYLATMRSFRGVPSAALIRDGATEAVVRATVRHDDGREVLVEARLAREGRNVIHVNRRRLARARDLLGVVRTTVFSPDDLELVKGGPQLRRDWLDDALVALAVRHDALRLEVDRVVRQRNATLKAAAGRLGDAVASMLDAWDAKYADVGTRLGDARAHLVGRLAPEVDRAYGDLAGRAGVVALGYEPAWRAAGLAAALAAARPEDVRRGLTTVGPHRDDASLAIAGLDARTHASQGEQRTLALAMRLAVHRLVTQETGESPVLVLDDVLSELDDRRATALLAHVPAGQALITSASALPSAAHIVQCVRIVSGALEATT
jgi:DNA replication and repair protein RecF